MNNSTPFTPEEWLYSIYGRTPPVQCTGRLVTERNLMSSDFIDIGSLIRKMRHEADKDNTDIQPPLNYGASLINWLENCSSVNPLPPHHRCPVCKKVIFSDEADGWDLPPL